MSANLSRILQDIHRNAGIEGETPGEPLIQMEAEPEARAEPLIESAGENYERPISVCFAGVGTFGANNLLSLKSQNKKSEMVRFLGIHSDGSSIKELEKNGFEDIISLKSDESKYLLGAGGDVKSGEKLGENYYEEFVKKFKQDDLVLVVTGMGGGTGTGVAPYVAKAAKEAQGGKKNKLTIGIASMPGVEEFDRRRLAEPGIEKLRQHVDALVVVDQMKLLDVLGDVDTASMDLADDLIKSRFQIVLQSIMDAVTEYTARNIDFADICSTLKESGEAIITTVQAPSEPIEEIKRKLVEAINDKLLVDHSNKIASRLLVYPFYQPSYPLRYHFEIVSEVQKLFGWKLKDGSYSCDLDNLPEGMLASAKVGAGSGEKYSGITKVIIMAAGFADKPAPTLAPAPKPVTAAMPVIAPLPPPIIVPPQPQLQAAEPQKSQPKQENPSSLEEFLRTFNM